MNLAYAVIGGGFMDASGDPLANGVLSARLMRACRDLATGTTAICNQAVNYELDDDGNVSTDPLQFIIPSDLMTTDWGEAGTPVPISNDQTYYWLQAEDDNGQIVYGPNAFYLLAANSTSYVVREVLAPTGSQTVYTLQSTPLANSLFVFRNGIFQTVGIDFSLSGATITFFSAPLSSDTVTAVYTDSTIPAAVAPTFQAESLSPGSTTYTLGEAPANGTVSVYQNGVFQSPNGVDYNISGSTITFTSTTFGALRVVYQTSAGFVGLTGEQPSRGTSTAIFTLSTSPDPDSLMFYVGGLYQTSGVNFDYVLNGNQETFNSGSVPASNAVIFAMFNLSQIINLSDPAYAPTNPA